MTLQEQLDAKLHELVAAEAAVVAQYSTSGSSLFTVGGANVAGYITQAQNGIDTLQGPLYDAVMGGTNFPLDTGTGPDQVGALKAWNQLAQSTQSLLSNSLHYVTTWGPFPFLEGVARQLTDPTAWPWWLQALAAMGIVYYGSKLLGAAGEARKAWSGYRPRRRRRA